MDTDVYGGFDKRQWKGFPVREVEITDHPDYAIIYIDPMNSDEKPENCMIAYWDTPEEAERRYESFISALMLETYNVLRLRNGAMKILYISFRGNYEDVTGGKSNGM